MYKWYLSNRDLGCLHCLCSRCGHLRDGQGATGEGGRWPTLLATVALGNRYLNLLIKPFPTAFLGSLLPLIIEILDLRWKKEKKDQTHRTGSWLEEASVWEHILNFMKLCVSKVLIVMSNLEQIGAVGRREMISLVIFLKALLSILLNFILSVHHSKYSCPFMTLSLSDGQK